MKSWLILCLMVFLTGVIRGQVVADYPLDKYVDESDVIVEGEVTGRSSFFGADGLIYTRYDVDVSAVYYGSTDKHISYVEVGGLVGDEALEVCPSLHLQVGSKGVIGLRSRQLEGEGTVHVPVSSVSSWINYNEESRTFTDHSGRVYHATAFEDLMRDLTGEESVRYRSLDATDGPDMVPSITSLSPTTTQAGRGNVITINGSGFGSSRGSGDVEFRNANYPVGYYLDGIQYPEWTDTRIRAVVPSGAGNGAIRVRTGAGSRTTAAQSLTVTYNVLNVNLTEHPYHIDYPNYDNGGYAFVYSTNTGSGGVDFTSIPAAIAAVERATSTWNSGSGFAIFTEEICGTSTIQVPSRDGVNLITFDNNNYTLGSSVLGLTFSYYSKCGSTQWEVLEIDMILQRDVSDGGHADWEYGPGAPSGGEVDFESVVLHELGHGHQLGHTRVSGAVMYPSIFVGSTNRSLASADQTGGSYCQTQSLGYTPPIIACGWPFNVARQYEAYNSSNRCSAFLPVELISFDVRNGHDRSLRIEWETAYEIRHREIQLQYRSKSQWPISGVDSDDWTKLKTYPASTSTVSSNTEYSFDHENLRPDIYYYRLKIVSLDGEIEYSDILSGEIRGEELEVSYLRENGGMRLWISNPGHEDIDMGLYSLDGRVMDRFHITGDSDYQSVRLELDGSPAGIYLLKWSAVTGEAGETRKIFLH